MFQSEGSWSKKQTNKGKEKEWKIMNEKKMKWRNYVGKKMVKLYKNLRISKEKELKSEKSKNKERNKWKGRKSVQREWLRKKNIKKRIKRINERK